MADAAPSAPSMQLSDIVVSVKEERSDSVDVRNLTEKQCLGEISLILDDWLYLGNRTHAHCKDLLDRLQITHILNVSQLIKNAWPQSIQYAQIAVMDDSSVRLFDYFEASACFIDECNPLNYDLFQQKKRKILVHCAMGISRSATIIISYLMARSFLLSDKEQGILNDIQHKMELFDKALEHKLDKQTLDKHRNNKDYTKRTRQHYEQMEYESENGIICKGMTLGEAYLFVSECRSIICPNIGFCNQLSEWEQFVWDDNDSTKYQLPFFSPLIEDDDQKTSSEQIETSEIDSGCCSIL